MYESFTQLLRDIIPNPLVPFKLVARAAGVLYLTSIILPLLTDRIGFSSYTSWHNTEPIPLAAPFDPELILISGFGVVAGSAEAYGDAGGGPSGLGIALVDFLLTPFFLVTFPAVGLLLTAAIPLLGVAFLLGHQRYATHLTWGFFLMFAFYIMMFGMNAATLHSEFGLHLVHIATVLMLFVSVDKYHRIGLVSGNGYTHPEATERTADELKPIISNDGISLRSPKLISDVFLFMSQDSTKDNCEVENDNEQRDEVVYAGSAKRNSIKND